MTTPEERKLEEKLWRAYRTARGITVRNRLVEHYQELLIKIAKMIHHRLPVQESTKIELEDLQGFGAIGLIQAVEGFESGRGVRFNTYATYRIRGAILDELRKMDWIPRGARSKAIEQIVSLYGETGETSIIDTIEERTEGDPFDAIADADFKKFIQADLNKRERYILLAYYFDGRTYQDIGRSLGVTRERIRQILEELLEKIRRTYRREIAHE